MYLAPYIQDSTEVLVPKPKNYINVVMNFHGEKAADELSYVSSSTFLHATIVQRVGESDISCVQVGWCVLTVWELTQCVFVEDPCVL